MIADSSTMAEFIATNLLSKEMDHTQLEPTMLVEDNMSTISMINNEINSNKTKHIEIRLARSENTC